MVSDNDTPTITRRRSVLACSRCRARRVKCDRAQPACSNCVKTGSICRPAHFSSLAPSPTLTGASSESRIFLLEREISRLSQEINSVTPTPELSRTPSLKSSRDEGAPRSRGLLFQSLNPYYFSPISCIPACEQTPRAISALEAMGKKQNEDIGGLHQAIASSLPDQSLHDNLVRMYCERVDPLIRLLHIPSFASASHTFRERIKRTYENKHPEAQPLDASRDAAHDAAHKADFASLLFAVYYAAFVSTMHDAEIPGSSLVADRRMFGALLRKEVTAHILTLKARIPSMYQLQAIVLVLSVGSSDLDLRTERLHLNNAIAMARELGVHRDGSHFGLEPMETELRRRVWAHLCIIDLRCAMQLGLESFISSDSYDSAMPLGFGGQDLFTKVDDNGQRAAHGLCHTLQGPGFDYGQDLALTSMAVTIVNVECARLFSNLAAIQYRPRDALSYTSAKGADGAPSFMDRLHLIERAEKKFRVFHELRDSDPGNLQLSLAAEIATINIMIAKFVARMREWKEQHDGGEQQENTEDYTLLFREAVTVGAQTVSLIQRFSNTPFAWFTQNCKCIYSSTFLLTNSAFKDVMDEESREEAWKVLAQLYPLDSQGNPLEQGLQQTLFGQLYLQGAAARSHCTAPGYKPNQGGTHAVASTPSAVPVSITHEPPTMPAGSIAETNTALQQPISAFEGMDVVMQGSPWFEGMMAPSTALSAWDTVLGAQHLASYSSVPAVGGSSLQQPYVQPEYQSGRRYQARPPNSAHNHPSTTSQADPCVNTSFLSPMPPPIFHVESIPSNMPHATVNQNVDMAAMDPSRPWSLVQNQLHLPQAARHSRERSLSQPQESQHLQVGPPRLTTRSKSLAMTESTPLVYDQDTRAFRSSPHPYQ